MSVNLLLDIGNSRLKWAWSDGDKLSHHGAAVRDDTVFSTLATAWSLMQKPDRIIASNVAGDAFAECLNAWVRTQWPLSVEYVTVEQGRAGLEIAYPQPHLFGVDRWVALIAVRHLYEGAVCVIDCGTAVTIDAVNANGKHLGGVIVPGFELMQHALLQRSSGVSRGVESGRMMSRSLLGHDTRSGIELGALYAVAGAITHTQARIKAAVSAPLTSVVTGGDAGMVLAEIGAKYHHSPHLLLQGLQFLVER